MNYLNNSNYLGNYPYNYANQYVPQPQPQQFISQPMAPQTQQPQSHSMPQQVHQHYYPIPEYDRPYYRDMDRDYGKMYYDGNGGSYRGNDTRGNGRDFRRPEYFMPIQDFPQYPREIRDVREGRSPMTRRSYMESKEMHKGKEVEMQELEKYMQELSTDITDMIKEASPEEKQMLQQKLTLLASKVK